MSSSKIQKHDLDEQLVLPIENGGTGATTAEDALRALGVYDKFLALTGGTLSGNVIIEKSSYPYVILNDSTSGTDARFGNYSQSACLEVRNVAGSTTNRRRLNISTSTSGEDPILLFDTVNGTQKKYKVFSEYNSNRTQLVSSETTPTTNNEIYWKYE